jgi:diguanylate cyclase (GGDEF)-like protein
VPRGYPVLILVTTILPAACFVGGWWALLPFAQQVEVGSIATHLAMLLFITEATRRLRHQVRRRKEQAPPPPQSDALTGLANRATFMSRLEAALGHADRGDRPVSVLFFDVDNFKVVNDALGHTAGDELLVAIANRLRADLPDSDAFAARLGGDEFTVLLEGASTLGDAARLASHIAALLKDAFVIADQTIYVTISVGIATSRSADDRPDDIIRNADLALYDAKRQGKNRFKVFDSSLTTRALERLQMEGDLRQAVDRGEFRVHYQPLVELESGSIRGVEALARWEHPVRGWVSPADFIPVAEQTGLILTIGEWVLAEACRQGRVWYDELGEHAPSVSANLSPRQFQQPDLVERVARILAETRLPASFLKLEITEGVAMEDAELAVATLWALRGLGIQLAIDDFGTGYSSLSYLKRFPVDTLKVDRVFVDGIGQYPEDEAIIGAVTAFARTLGVDVTAEGIETAEQLERLRELGVDTGQGYYFARPLAAEHITARLASGRAVRGGLQVLAA